MYFLWTGETHYPGPPALFQVGPPPIQNNFFRPWGHYTSGSPGTRRSSYTPSCPSSKRWWRYLIALVNLTPLSCWSAQRYNLAINSEQTAQSCPPHRCSKVEYIMACSACAEVSAAYDVTANKQHATLTFSIGVYGDPAAANFCSGTSGEYSVISLLLGWNSARHRWFLCRPKGLKVVRTYSLQC